MEALLKPGSLDQMPNVAAWLRHSHAAQGVVHKCYPELEHKDKLRVLALENIVCQIAHLRTHPSVASAIASGQLALHGWFVDIHAGAIFALDSERGQFQPVRDDAPLPVALPHASRLAAVPLLKKSA
jgi:carbonic anhydrase